MISSVQGSLVGFRSVSIQLHEEAARFANLMYLTFVSAAASDYTEARAIVLERKWPVADIWRAIGIQLLKLDFLGKVGSKNTNIREMRMLLSDIRCASRELPVDGRLMRQATAESVSSQAMTLARRSPWVSLRLLLLALQTSPGGAVANLRSQANKARRASRLGFV